MATIRQQAANNQETARQIISRASATISDEVRAQFPTYHATKRLIERVRRRANRPYPNPNALNEIAIPQPLTVTKQGDLFLYHDSGADDPERFLIFATESNMEFLQQNQVYSIIFPII